MCSVLSFTSNINASVLVLSGAGIRYCGVPAHYNLKLLTLFSCFTIPIAFWKKAAEEWKAAAASTTVVTVFLLVKRVRLANYRLGLV
jgi:hypothetical protein